MEAEAKLSEAAERKRCPEGRGGRDRPVEVRIQQQAERCQELGHVRVAPLFHRLWQDVCSRSPCEVPFQATPQQDAGIPIAHNGQRKPQPYWHLPP